jgi:hypothetical protein
LLLVRYLLKTEMLGYLDERAVVGCAEFAMQSGSPRFLQCF